MSKVPTGSEAFAVYSGRHQTLYGRVGKRVLDLLIAAAVLLVLGLPMLLFAVLIWIEDRGPVFYKQERVGRFGVPFKMTKFRSMVVGAEKKGAGILVEKNDRRITRIGKFLRRTSLDELAQIFDVIRGDMSVIGPRPGLQYQFELYDDEQRRRLCVRPGITGWAQVKGRNAITWPDRIRLDLEYIDRLSLFSDIKILVLTLPAILSGSNQIADADYWKTKRAEREREGRA